MRSASANCMPAWLARDPETAAELRPTDPQRVVRAWEVLEATGPAAGSMAARRKARRCWKG